MNAKQIAAVKAVDHIADGMTVGLGSGSTAFYAIQRLGERVKEGLKIKTVATSIKSESVAKAFDIPVFAVSEIDKIDITVDGADEIDEAGNLIKGGGGSLLREKIIAFASHKFHVMADERKLVRQLGSFPLPVEVIPFGLELTIRHLKALDSRPATRMAKNKPFITDNGNLIVDCKFESISDPAWLDMKIKMIPGVIETGIFSHKIVTSIIVGYGNGEVSERFLQA